MDLGFILISTHPSDRVAVRRFLDGFGAVHSVQRIRGPYDLLIRASVRRIAEVADLLRSLPGVTGTTVCVPVTGRLVPGGA